jgi:peptidoglycan/xylan/chitin deacetylase (PgdA/CDA1 family)
MWNGKKKALTFSFDDGVTQHERLIAMLDRYGMHATFNINSGFFGGKNELIRNGVAVRHDKLSAEEARRVYAGHEVAAHTLTHPNLTACSDAEIIRQVEQDRLALSELAGYEVIGMAYPCGGVNNDDRVADIIKNHTGVAYCRTITNTDSFDQQENLYRFNPNVYHIMEFDRLMEMGQRFIEMKPDKPQIFYIWGHSYEMDYHPGDWERLEEFFRLISNHDDIFYGTNKEVLL